MSKNSLLSDAQKDAAKKLEIFKSKIKTQLTEKDEKLKSITNVFGKKPLPLEELIDSSIDIHRFDYWINTEYDIPVEIQNKIKLIYESVFEK